MIKTISVQAAKCKYCGHEWVIRSKKQDKKWFMCSKCLKATRVEKK